MCYDEWDRVMFMGSVALLWRNYRPIYLTIVIGRCTDTFREVLYWYTNLWKYLFYASKVSSQKQTRLVRFSHRHLFLSRVLPPQLASFCRLALSRSLQFHFIFEIEHDKHMPTQINEEYIKSFGVLFIYKPRRRYNKLHVAALMARLRYLWKILVGIYLRYRSYTWT